jgi:hypothetical protein
VEISCAHYQLYRNPSNALASAREEIATSVWLLVSGHFVHQGWQGVLIGGFMNNI